MDYALILFLLVFSFSLLGLVATWIRARFAATGWMVLHLAILMLAVVGRWGEQPAIVYAAASLWFLLILLPGVIWRLYNRRFLQQEYAAARRLARIISWLHPADGWRELPKIIHALELSKQGQLAAASDVLNRFHDVKSLTGLVAVAILYRITDQWEEAVAWQSRHTREIERQREFFSFVLRAYGETGDVPGLVQYYDRHRRQIGKLVPMTHRDMCRLMLFAFCGKRQAVEGLCAGSLAVLPVPTRAFWLATADLQAGESESAKRQLEELLPAADPLLRRAIERRLSRIAALPAPLDAPAERVVEEASREQGHEERFGVQRSLFSRRARGTQLLMALNAAMFVVESCLGGSTDPDVLFRLGAFFAPAVRAGQWWRLITAGFLHFGALHLAMNMLGLWILGPFVEFALGFRRFVLVYLLTGVGAAAMVMAFASAASAETLSVGASGSIMGLVGATGALMLRGWLREKALVAKRRLVLMFLIVATQALLDCAIPQFSMTAHLSGALIGFAATLLLPDRLKLPASPQPPAK